MTQDEIIRMAREAGFWSQQYEGYPERLIDSRVERFANLVAEATKEKAAKVCEERADAYKYETDPWAHEHRMTATICAAAIRSME